jgi:hypothetical protein
MSCTQRKLEQFPIIMKLFLKLAHVTDTVGGGVESDCS